MVGLNNQRLAALTGCNYDQELLIPGKLAYSRTHTVQFDTLATFGDCTLVTSFSDASVTDDLASKLPANVSRWFSNNVMTDDPRVVSVPIGLVYNIEREAHLLAAIDKGPQPRRNLMYVCFTRVGNRIGMYEQFGQSWATQKGGNAFSSVSPSEFYDDILAHDYVLSPEGAGPDCHRHWEALILGSIPIIKRSKAVQILADQPVLMVDNWDEVTEARLLAELPRIKAIPFRRELVDIEFWRDKICS